MSAYAAPVLLSSVPTVGLLLMVLLPALLWWRFRAVSLLAAHARRALLLQLLLIGFSALVLAVGLRAAAADLTLWRTLAEVVGASVLLFWFSATLVGMVRAWRGAPPRSWAADRLRSWRSGRSG